MITDLTGFAADRPAILWFVFLAVVPFIAVPRRTSGWAWLGAVPADRLSVVVDVALRTLGSVAIVALVLGVSGLYRPGGTIQKIGQGAHVVLLIDRSSSMNHSFAGRTPDGDEESKAAAAKRLLKGFASRRPQDRVGVAAFSTMPLLVLPLTDSQAAIEAAIGAIDQPGLTYTDVGRGLAMAFSMFDEDHDPLASRAVVLVSDGAALVDLRVQDILRTALVARPVNLYWLFLRSVGSPGIHDLPENPSRDTPQAMPERHLNLFFQTLGVPYRAFEAESVQDVARAFEEIDKQEQAPLRYTERLPRQDWSGYAYGLATMAVLILVLAIMAERQIGPTMTRRRYD